MSEIEEKKKEKKDAGQEKEKKEKEIKEKLQRLGKNEEKNDADREESRGLMSTEATDEAWHRPRTHDEGD